jgi:CRP/FNR family transcriptional regulator, cyclic AMP receptor protein
MPNDFLGLFGSDTETITLEAGQVLFQQGDPADGFYVVKSGELQVLNGNHVFETVGKGGIVGEMALVDGGSRSATARAVTASQIIPIDEKRFLFMVGQTPNFALRVMKVMSARLRAMNDRARAMPEKATKASA